MTLRSARMFTLISALIVVVPLADGRRASAGSGDKAITLSGCLIRGEGTSAGYVLTNRPFEPSPDNRVEARVTPGTLGTTGDFANVFYWLDGDRDLRKHVGHQVEIEGSAKGDVKDGAIKIDRHENWTEMSVQSDGRKMKARVPNSSIVGGHDAHKKMNVLVRKIDVKHVRMLGATCAS